MPAKKRPDKAEQLLIDIFSNNHERGTMTNLQISTYQRKPFFVEAVRVTEENISELAEWCSGEAKESKTDAGGSFIKVKVHRPLNERQTRAYPGDWVLYAGTGYKVYTDQAFQKCFVAQPEAAEVSEVV